MRRLLMMFASILLISCNAPKTATKDNTMKEILQPYNFPVKKIQLTDGELAYTKSGKGEKVLVFVHGLSSNADAWYRNIEDLQKDFTCYAIDLPGYGKSYLKAPAYTPTYFAQVVKEFTDKLKIEHFTIVGHSMGGQAALKFASKYPEKLDKIILVAPAGLEEFNEMEAAGIRMFTTETAVKNTTDEQIDKNYQINFYQMPTEAATMIADRKAIKNSSDFNDHVAAIVASVKGMLDDKVVDDLPNIKTPALIIFAKNDVLIPNKYLHPNMSVEEVAAKGEKLLQNSKSVMIDKAGHFTMFEKPQEVNAAIRNFLLVE